jgi:hypothetical protein
LGYCLDANAGQIQAFGQVMEWGCNPYDDFDQWHQIEETYTQWGIASFFDNAGGQFDYNTQDCLEANYQEVYNGGQIMQWGCSPNDPYSQWIVYHEPDGWNQLMNYGDMLYNHVAMCLDADGSPSEFGNPSPLYNGAPIFQWACNSNDGWQLWGFFNGDLGSSDPNIFQLVVQPGSGLSP